jgi:hypothetical protein
MIMIDTITAGSILVEGGTLLPGSLRLQSESDSNGWAAFQDVRSTFEKTIQAEGWNFFFMAGELKTSVFGFDRQRSLRTALKRLIAGVKSQHCNSIEIAEVVDHSFLSVPYVSVSAHPRNLQKGMYFSANGVGSDPALIRRFNSNGG